MLVVYVDGQVIEDPNVSPKTALVLTTENAIKNEFQSVFAGVFGMPVYGVYDLAKVLKEGEYLRIAEKSVQRIESDFGPTFQVDELEPEGPWKKVEVEDILPRLVPEAEIPANEVFERLGIERLDRKQIKTTSLFLMAAVLVFTAGYFYLNSKASSVEREVDGLQAQVAALKQKLSNFKSRLYALKDSSFSQALSEIEKLEEIPFVKVLKLEYEKGIGLNFKGLVNYWNYGEAVKVCRQMKNCRINYYGGEDYYEVILGKGKR